MYISPGFLFGSSSLLSCSFAFSLSALAFPARVFSASAFRFARSSCALRAWISRSFLRLAFVASSSSELDQSPSISSEDSSDSR